MRVGLISDVHGNEPALQAVLAELASDDVDLIVHAGDAIGYGPDPSGVIETMRSRSIISIRGNHDRGIEDGEAFANTYGSVAVRSLSWTRNQLTDSDRAYLALLPIETTLADGRIRVVHGAPGRPDQYVYPDEIQPSLLGDEEVLVLGHTHHQVARAYENGLVVNPGSVGQPRDGDPTAAYAVLDLESQALSLRRVSYPVEAVTTAIEASGLPDVLVEKLTTA